MKVKSGFLLREIGGTYVLVPLGERVVDFNGLATLNDTGQVLWTRLTEGCREADLVEALTSEFDVTEEEAAQDVRAFVRDLQEKRLLEDDGSPL